MVITLNIQGASPEEIREACKQFAEMGVNSRIVVKPEDLGISQAPAPSQDIPKIPEPDKKFRYSVPRKLHRYTQEQNEYIRELVRQGIDKEGITRAFNKRYDTNISVSAIQRRMGRID